MRCVSGDRMPGARPGYFLLPMDEENTMQVLAALVVPVFASLAVLWIGLNVSSARR